MSKASDKMEATARENVRLRGELAALRRELDASRGRTKAAAERNRRARRSLSRHLGGSPGPSLTDALAEVQAWQGETFGDASPLRARLSKLREEVAELDEARVEYEHAALLEQAGAGIPGSVQALRGEMVEEAADVAFLLVDILRALGATPADLARAVSAKLERNRARDWSQRADGTFHGSKGDE